jgi:hypothetical protein
MGTVIHEATLVTSWDADLIAKARKKALKIFHKPMVTRVLLSEINEYSSFAIMTCGSMEGWEHKRLDQENREKFLKWVSEQAYEDGSNALEIGSIRYGNDLQ